MVVTDVAGGLSIYFHPEALPALLAIFFRALSGNPQLQIGVFADTALVIY